ncbi:MAG TPA: hypothetical protein PK225_08475 [Azonexus sp.]|jgi:hypothetical protein|nr:hypothetical protein [Azonexus sp.]
MKFVSGDVGKLQWVALLTVVLIAIAIAAGIWSASGVRQARAERDAVATRKIEIERRLGRVRTEEQEIKARTQQFQQMEIAGIIGQEKRLDWTELLRDLQRQLRLPGMNYEFGPQIPLDSIPGAGYAYHSSQLKIQLRVLHEEDLLSFVSQLQKQAKAVVLLHGCKLSRLPGASPVGDAAQLVGECTMEWVTVRRATGTKQP